MSFAANYGPWALIAGASEGTGRAFARKIAAQGVPSVLIARRREPLEQVAAEIRAESGVVCETASIDLAQGDAFERIVAAVGEREIGLFVANAGADPNGAKFLDRDIETWINLVNRGVIATMRCCHHFGGLMRARGKGGLLLVGSGACYGGAKFMAVYSAGKAFELCFAESLWSELQPHGVDVLYAVLGKTDTPAFRQLLAEKGLPAPSDMAAPDEVAEICLTRLKNGPVYNWGQADDAAGYAPSSAAARRMRIKAIDQGGKAVFGD